MIGLEMTRVDSDWQTRLFVKFHLFILQTRSKSVIVHF